MSFVKHMKRSKASTLVVLDLNGILVLRLHENQLPSNWDKEERDKHLSKAKKLTNGFYVWSRP